MEDLETSCQNRAEQFKLYRAVSSAMFLSYVIKVSPFSSVSVLQLVNFLHWKNLEWMVPRNQLLKTSDEKCPQF